MRKNLQLSRRPGWRPVAVVATVVLFVAGVRVAPVFAYTSESPEVKAMVDLGIRFLETAVMTSGDGDAQDSGALWFVGATLAKAGKDETQPTIALGIKRCQDIQKAGQTESDKRGIYAKAMAVIFLCEVDPVKYKSEATYFLDQLLSTQLPSGGFGYPAMGIPDPSQTQYGVLAMWSADHVGLDVPTERIEKALHWLLRVQDLGGGWSYLSQDLGGTNRANQFATTHALTAGGLGSLYICADMLGLSAQAEAPKDNDGLPPALKAVKAEKEKKEAKRRRTSKFDTAFLKRGQADGNGWFGKNYRIDPDKWPLYYLYALERYQSFREVAEHRNEKEPGWYNDGVNFLKTRQQNNGSWSGDHSPHASTCFAILFLIRSTKKAIAKDVTTEGALAGGRGLPKDVTNVKMKGNQVVGAQAAKSIDDLLDLLESTDNAALENAVEGATILPLGGDATTRAKQAERLRKIVSLPNYQARMVAVKSLSQARDLENVPVLIYALGDPDWRVAKEARDGLRLISRRFDGFDMPDASTPAQRTAAQLNWKKWYLSIRPEAEFLD